MIRLRRLRGSEAIRNMVRENRVNKEDLVYPMFVAEGTGIKNPVDSMPGIYQYSLDTFEEELRRVADAGISAVLLFGIPAHKDEVGSSAYDDQGIMQKAVRRIKELYPDMIVIADICCVSTHHTATAELSMTARYSTMRLFHIWARWLYHLQRLAQTWWLRRI